MNFWGETGTISLILSVIAAYYVGFNWWWIRKRIFIPLALVPLFYTSIVWGRLWGGFNAGVFCFAISFFILIFPFFGGMEVRRKINKAWISAAINEDRANGQTHY